MSDQPLEPSVGQVEFHRSVALAANADIISGWHFCATMQLRTPFRVLSRHGEVHEGLTSEPPVIVHEQWEGIWIIKTRSFRELGIDIDEPSFTMASDVGPVPADGGDYLAFLKRARMIAEADRPPADRRQALAEMLHDPASADFVDRLGGPEALLDRLFPRFISSIPRVSTATAKALIAAGYRTANEISAASDSDLFAIERVGPGTVKVLREAVLSTSDGDAEFLDCVAR